MEDEYCAMSRIAMVFLDPILVNCYVTKTKYIITRNLNIPFI